MNRHARLAVPLVLLMSVGMAHADLVITFSDTNILPNTTGTVDVFVTGEAGGGDNPIDDFEVVIGIEEIDAGNSRLKFRTEPNQSTSYTSESDYIFNAYGTVPIIDISSDPLGGLDPEGFPLRNRAAVTDSIFLIDEVVVEAGETNLIARLALEHVTQAVPASLAAGNTFRLFVVSSIFLGSDGPIIPDDIPSDVTSVPEPSTFGLVILCAGVAVVVGWKRRKDYGFGSSKGSSTG